MANHPQGDRLNRRELVRRFVGKVRNPTLRNAGHAHCFEEFVNRSRRDALNVCFLDNGNERFLSRSPRREETRKIAPVAVFWDSQINRAGSCLPSSFTISIAGVFTLAGPLRVNGVMATLNVHFHKPMHDEGEHLE